MDEDNEVSFQNIREVLKRFIGRKVVDITSTDWDEVQRGEPDEVVLFFDDGNTLTFPVGSTGFHYSDEE